MLRIIRTPLLYGIAAFFASGSAISQNDPGKEKELPGWYYLTSSKRYAFYGRDMHLIDKRLLLWVKSVSREEPDDCNRYPFLSSSNSSCYDKREHEMYSSVERWEIDCRLKRYRVIGSTQYNLDGKVLTTTAEPEEWGLLTPDSVAEGIAKPLCKAKLAPT